MSTEDPIKLAVIDGVEAVLVDVTTNAQVTLAPVTRIVSINYDKDAKRFAVPAEAKEKFGVGQGGTIYWLAPYPITVEFDRDPPDTSKPNEVQFQSKQFAPGLHAASVTLGGHPPGKELRYTIFVTIPPGVKVPVDPSIIIDTGFNRFAVQRK